MAGQTAQDREAAYEINEMSGVRITAQIQLKGVAFALEATVMSDEEAAINGLLDRFAKVVGRQNAKLELTEKLVALAANREMIAAIEPDRTKMLKDTEDERTRQLLSLKAAHEVAGRRSVFHLPQGFQKQFDDKVVQIMRQFDERLSQLQQDVPLIERQIARLRDVIAGVDPEEAPLAQAAE